MGGVRKGYSQRTIMSLFVGESKFLLLWMMATVFNAIFSVPAVAPLPTAPAGSRRTQVFGRRAVDPESNLSRIQMPSDFAEQDCPSPSRNSYPTIGWEPTSEAKRPKDPAAPALPSEAERMQPPDVPSFQEEPVSTADAGRAVQQSPMVSMRQNL